MPRIHWKKAPPRVLERMLIILDREGPYMAVKECIDQGYDFPDIESHCPLHRKTKDFLEMGQPHEARLVASRNSIAWDLEKKAIAIIAARRDWAATTSLESDAEREAAKAAVRAEERRQREIESRTREILARQTREREIAARALAEKELAAEGK